MIYGFKRFVLPSLEYTRVTSVGCFGNSKREPITIPKKCHIQGKNMNSTILHMIKRTSLKSEYETNIQQELN
jgi:hypothetical protein